MCRTCVRCLHGCVHLPCVRVLNMHLEMHKQMCASVRTATCVCMRGQHASRIPQTRLCICPHAHVRVYVWSTCIWKCTISFVYLSARACVCVANSHPEVHNKICEYVRTRTCMCMRGQHASSNARTTLCICPHAHVRVHAWSTCILKCTNKIV